ncbi:MAG: amidohydrolase [Burkholderiales bacterium]|nr:amidohydrolase [Burkholderiales bacterium]
MSRFIDVHHHLLPQLYIDAVGRGPITDQAPRRAAAALDWSAAGSLAEMDANGVAAAVLSVSAPGVWFGDNARASRLARACNDYTAGLVRTHPRRFGMFAALALPDVDAALAEVAHAGDTLGADGFCLMSSYANRYLGDPAFAPVFDELNRRRAVVFVHPTASDASKGLLPGIPASTMEFVLDTTRTVMSLLYSGTLSRCAGIRFIFSHAGGTVPFIAHRMCRLESQEEFARLVPEGAMRALTRQYYDTALSANPAALAALEKFVPASQILYGSDYPFAVGMMKKTIDGLAAYDFAPAARAAIERDNAARLFPRLAA